MTLLEKVALVLLVLIVLVCAYGAGMDLALRHEARRQRRTRNMTARIDEIEAAAERARQDRGRS